VAYWCPHCRKVHYAPLPAAVEKTGRIDQATPRGESPKGEQGAAFVVHGGRTDAGAVEVGPQES